MEVLESKQYLYDCKNQYLNYKTTCSRLQEKEGFYEKLEQDIDNIDEEKYPEGSLDTIKKLIEDVEGCYSLRIKYNNDCYVYAFNSLRINRLKNTIDERVYTLLKTENAPFEVIESIASILKNPLQSLEPILDSIANSEGYTEFRDYVIPRLATYVTDDLVKSGDEISNHMYPIHRLLELNRKLKDKIRSIYLNFVNDRYNTLEEKIKIYKQRIPLERNIFDMFKAYDRVNRRIQELNRRADKLFINEIENLEQEINLYTNERSVQ